MNFEDTRSFSPQTQQALRKRAVAAVVEQGRKQGQLAQDLGVTRPAVNRGVQRYRARGQKALAARKQGRPNPTGSRPGGDNDPSHSKLCPRATAVAVCAVDPRGGGAANRAAVGRAVVPECRGSLLAPLGAVSSEASQTS